MSKVKVTGALNVKIVYIHYLENFLCPRYKMAGAYSVTQFVIPSSSVFIHYLSNGFTHSIET
jgi:hypothetical protein